MPLTKQQLLIPRVIFVGLHNKPGMKPLDSKTKSGKLIDRIIEKCSENGMNVLKTNLFDVDEMPTLKEMNSLALDWIDRVPLFGDDVIVLLGAWVHSHFPPINHTTITPIKIAHPASKRSHEDMNLYVENTFKLIKKNIDHATN